MQRSLIPFLALFWSVHSLQCWGMFLKIIIQFKNKRQKDKKPKEEEKVNWKRTHHSHALPQCFLNTDLTARPTHIPCTQDTLREGSPNPENHLFPFSSLAEIHSYARKSPVRALDAKTWGTAAGSGPPPTGLSALGAWVGPTRPLPAPTQNTTTVLQKRCLFQHWLHRLHLRCGFFPHTAVVEAQLLKKDYKHFVNTKCLIIVHPMKSFWRLKQWWQCLFWFSFSDDIDDDNYNNNNKNSPPTGHTGLATSYKKHKGVNFSLQAQDTLHHHALLTWGRFY